MADAKIDHNRLTLPETVCRSLGDEAISPVSFSSGHLFLSRPEDDCPVLLAGVLEEGAVPDLLSYFNMFRKTGVLTVQLQAGSKDLYFQDGEVVFATSSLESEDLGAVLFSLGKISEKDLKQLRAMVTEQSPLGKLLVERGEVSPKDLWSAARIQVESIVYNLFAALGGGFYFRAQELAPDQSLRLSMNTQNLIMEGLRRLDEKALFMRKIVSLDYYPKETEREAVDLGQDETALYRQAQSGQLTAAELFRKLGLHEFEGMRILHDLLGRKLLCMEDGPAIEIVGTAGQILAVYNSLFRVLYSRIVAVCSSYPDEIAQELKGLPQPYSFVLRDVEIKTDGNLDGYRIIANLGGLEEGDKNKLLADVLCEVAYMMTMALRRELDAEQARPLIARVQEVTARVKGLAGS